LKANRARVDGWPPRDRAGAIEPHKLNAISLFRAIPSAAKLFQTIVPEQFWSEHEDPETGEVVAIISCGCGETCWVGGATITECACGRFFLHLSDEVRCYRPEADEEAKS